MSFSCSGKEAFTEYRHLKESPVRKVASEQLSCLLRSDLFASASVANSTSTYTLLLYHIFLHLLYLLAISSLLSVLIYDHLGLETALHRK